MYSLGANFSLVNGSTTATYTTSEPDSANFPLLVNAGTPQDVVFNLPVVQYVNSFQPLDPVLQGSGTGQSEILGAYFEPTTFADPAHSVTVNETNPASSILSVSESGASVIPFVTLNGGPGADTFNVQPTPGSVITINGGPSSNVLNFDAQEQPVGPVPGR